MKSCYLKNKNNNCSNNSIDKNCIQTCQYCIQYVLGATGPTGPTGP